MENNICVFCKTVACRHTLPNPLLNFKTTGLFASSIETSFLYRRNVVTVMLMPLEYESTCLVEEKHYLIQANVEVKDAYRGPQVWVLWLVSTMRLKTINKK
jgi:hypothetical protein